MRPPSWSRHPMVPFVFSLCLGVKANDKVMNVALHPCHTTFASLVSMYSGYILLSGEVTAYLLSYDVEH